jgi:hypothetical protein
VKMPQSKQRWYDRPHPGATGGPSASAKFRDSQDIHWWRTPSEERKTKGPSWRGNPRTVRLHSRRDISGAYAVLGSGKRLVVSKGRPAKTARYTAIESTDIFFGLTPTTGQIGMAGEYAITGTEPYSSNFPVWGPSERTKREQPRFALGNPTGAEAHRSVERLDAPEVSRERYTVSVRMAQFVLRGIHAAEQVARRQLGADPHWLALERQIPTENLSADGLVPWVTRRLLRMFRSLASEAREDGLPYRPLMEGGTWSLDVQFGILDRLPVRPDETSEFLRVLLLEILEAARAGGIISGRWGEVEFRSTNVPTLVIVPAARAQVESTATVSPVQFSRVRRSARGHEAGDGDI